MNRPAVLIVYDYPVGIGEMRVSITQHLRALESESHRLDITYYNSATTPEASLMRREFDAIVFHNTFLCFRWTDSFFYSWKLRHDWLRQRDCLKVAMPQDEYDHAELLDEWLLEWGVTHVLTNFGPEHRRTLHPLLWDRVAFHRCLTGYIDERSAERLVRALAPTHRRATGLVYRARNLPYWFGSFGQQKHLIADPVRLRAEALGWRCDVSTRNEDAVVGEKWLDFLASGRCVLGSEGGSSVLDQRGEVRTRIRGLIEANPAMTFEDVDRAMPEGWDSHRFATITPRHFEATITKTAQLLVEGEYDGILKPDLHYVPVRADLSDLDRALERLSDERVVSDIVERTYEEIYVSGQWTYHRLGELLAGIILGDGTPSRDDIVTREAPRAEVLLERQLIAERNHVALLEAQLAEAHSRLGAAQAGQSSASLAPTPPAVAMWPGRRRVILAGALLGILWLSSVIVAVLIALLMAAAPR